tara:strand:+ start:284 stop:856 length:573 start_codon:yes stop_codon:yes gene_type:complete
MQLFENDAAIVTGAGNGIGRAIAQALVREGVNTLFADINADTVAQAAEAAITADQESVGAVATPGEVHTWVVDLSEDGACASLLREAQSKLHEPTMLVHSASPPRHEKDNIFSVDTETWTRMRAVNVDAAFESIPGQDMGRQKHTRARVVTDVATYGNAAQSATLQLIESRHEHAGQGVCQVSGAPQHPG